MVVSIQPGLLVRFFCLSCLIDVKKLGILPEGLKISGIISELYKRFEEKRREQANLF
jgi:hypothetical protein